MSRKFIKLRSFYQRTFSELSGLFDTTNSVRQECSVSPFLYNFVSDEIIGFALGAPLDVSTELTDEGKLDFTGDLCLFQCIEHAQRGLGKLATAVAPSGMCFAPSKCRVLLRD